MIRHLFLTFTCALATIGTAASDAPPHPHVIVILVDDMGYGDPGCFNAESKIATPNIDRLAAEGMRFTDAHAPGPLCHMSRYGLMTGRYPFRTNVGVWPTQPLIDEGQTTIASLAKRQDYRTAMVGKWHLGFAENGYENPLPGGPVDHGFDQFFGIRASTDIPPYFYIRGDRAVQPPSNTIEANQTEGWSPIQGEFWRAGGIAPDLSLDEVLPRFTQEAIDVIKSHQRDTNAGIDQATDHPLMLYLAYPAPHTPWLPSAAFQGKSDAGLYGDFAMMVDAEIGKVIGALAQTGMLDESLVIMTSDNGPVWYDEDVERFDHDSAGPLRGMKADAWEAGHRMPFIVRWPGHVQPASQSDQLVCFTDIMATLADLWDVPLGDDEGPDSFSFLSALTADTEGDDASDAGRRTEIVMRPGGGRMMVIRKDDWKLIDGLGSGGFSKPRTITPTGNGINGQLYNLKNDLAESENLFGRYPDLVSQLRDRMKVIQKRGHRLVQD
ncbi:Arylsulfatase [Crateriforma conspicua]|uniref:Arylsulfatase n=2 Tax=Crateriforma conspicua TaxID=2527996 RepID=A0A5C5Y136_9PLAN|nr:Arylsulfatase [Crateriforma conspicua]TWT68529.1 Arylsulfatase [Crateriforma conspicua]